MSGYNAVVSSQPEGWSDKTVASQIQPSHSFKLADALLLGQFVRDHAAEFGVPVVFSMVDAQGTQRHFFSMDHAMLISHQLAYQKAWTAASLRMTTEKLGQQVQPDMELAGLQYTPGICCIGGGLPFWSGGQLLGAVGVSGGRVDQDIAIARFALAQFSRTRYPLEYSHHYKELTCVQAQRG